MCPKVSSCLLVLYIFCGTSFSFASDSTPSTGNSSHSESLIYYILDASGSMWGRAGGKIKIEVAKNVLSELLDTMPDNIQSGLTAYGHRRKGDCSDIEVLVPPGINNKSLMEKGVKSISPKGKTPLADSIVATINKIRNIEAASTIVLVSDGIETCGKDPCKVTKELKDSGINFVLHVVGFGVRDAYQKELQCVATAGGGKYFKVANAHELEETLKKVNHSVIEKTELPLTEILPLEEAPKKISQKISSSASSIRIKAVGPGRVLLKYPAWLKKPYYWKLVDPETGKEKARFSNFKKQLVPAGDYQLVWRQVEHGSKEVTLGEVITVQPGKTTEVSLATAVELNVADWVKRPYYWQLKDVRTGESIARFNQIKPQLVPPGNYDLIWRQSEHGSIEVNLGPVQVEADKLNKVEVTTAFHLVLAEWIPKKLYYWGLKKRGSRKYVAKFYRDFKPALVPAGEYQLVYRQSEHGSSDSYLGEIKIEKGKMNEFSLNTGVKLNPEDNLPPPYKVEFVKLDGEKRYKVTLHNNWGPVPLMSGKYKVNYHQDEHKSKKVTIVDSFQLPKGNLAEIDL